MNIQVESNLPDAKKLFEVCLNNPSQMFDLLRIDIKDLAEKTISQMLKSELSHFLGRSPYERDFSLPQNHRNGCYQRKYTAKNIGELKIKVPRDREGLFQSKLITRYDRYDKAIEHDLCLMFLSGLSTRSIELISKSLIGRKISKSEISNINKDLLTGIDAWRQRSLEGFNIKYLIVDGVYFSMRVGHKIEKIPMLVVIGVTFEGRKTFLAIQQGDKDSASTWKEIFKDLKSRGLNKDLIQLGIMDGLTGLMKVFGDEFPKAQVQRCQVHVARNVLTKMPKSQKKAAADDLRDIFYASNKDQALKYFESFKTKYADISSSGVRCLENVINECLTFFEFPETEWRSLRTTNSIERVNKEFKRRTKPMEILAGEKSAYRLLCFIALKMEIGWKSSPIHQDISGLLNSAQLRIRQ